ncbi:MAG: hypothetical protein ACTSW1_05835 [Candidatus Hodarchaeales archaeon]
MSREEKIKVEEKKAKLFRLPDGLEFYVLDDLVEQDIEVKASISNGGGGASRNAKRVVHAFIVHDPTIGTMPYNVWEEKTRETVMGTLRTDIAHSDTPHSDIPHADTVTITPSASLPSGFVCRDCGQPIPAGQYKCPNCGGLSTGVWS